MHGESMSDHLSATAFERAHLAKYMCIIDIVTLWSETTYCMKSVSTSPRLENSSYSGVGNIHKKRCDKPFSLLVGTSINARATPG